MAGLRNAGRVSPVSNAIKQEYELLATFVYSFNELVADLLADLEEPKNSRDELLHKTSKTLGAVNLATRNLLQDRAIEMSSDFWATSEDLGLTEMGANTSFPIQAPRRPATKETPLAAM